MHTHARMPSLPQVGARHIIFSHATLVTLVLLYFSRESRRIASQLKSKVNALCPFSPDSDFGRR